MKVYITNKIKNMSKTKLLIIIAIVLFCGALTNNFVNASKDLSKDLTATNWDKEATTEFEQNKEELMEYYDTNDEAYIVAELIKQGKNQMLIFFGLFALIVALIVTAFQLVMPMTLIFIFYFWLKKNYKYRLTESSFIASINHYYRDILKEYSIDVLDYIADLKLEYPKTLIAMLLQLEHKKMITITYDRIVINNNIDTTLLSNTEKYILSNIKDEKLHLQSVSQYEKIVEQEALNQKLLITKDYPRKRLLKDVLLTITGFLITISLLIITFSRINTIDFNNNPYLILGVMAFLFVIPVILFIYIVAKIISFVILHNQLKKKFQVVSKKGNDIKNKLDGLENFLKDFSNLSERSKEELIIWEEYLIYSVLFNQNDIISKHKNIISIGIV